MAACRQFCEAVVAAAAAASVPWVDTSMGTSGARVNMLGPPTPRILDTALICFAFVERGCESVRLLAGLEMEMEVLGGLET